MFSKRLLSYCLIISAFCGIKLEVNAQQSITGSTTIGTVIKVPPQYQPRLGDITMNQKIKLGYLTLDGKNNTINVDVPGITAEMNLETGGGNLTTDLKIFKIGINSEGMQKRHYLGLEGNIGDYNVVIELDFEPGMSAITGSTAREVSATKYTIRLINNKSGQTKTLNGTAGGAPASSTGKKLFESFDDGNFTANPRWSPVFPICEISDISGNPCLDVHYVPMGDHSGLIGVLISCGQSFRLEFDVYRRDPSVPQNNVHVGFSDGPPSEDHSRDFFITENDRRLLITYWGSRELNKVKLGGFDARWQHVIMTRSIAGKWEIQWDSNGRYNVTISGQDSFGTLNNPHLWIQCDGYYQSMNGAYFDNFKLETKD